MRGTVLGPYNEDHNIKGSILGSPHFGKLQLRVPSKGVPTIRISVKESKLGSPYFGKLPPQTPEGI